MNRAETIGNATIRFGDCRESMRAMIAAGEKVQMCVTSPPYFGLRDYGHDGQLGLELTPAEFVLAMVDVFELVRVLLADDGVLWLNLGDSYNAAGRTGHGTRQGFKRATNRASAEKADNCRPSVETLKPKDLIGIPWRVAFALQEAGWYLRQDIIWHKPNPMPESVTDRCTKAHEYLFLLSKNARYYFDGRAIAEKAKYSNIVGMDGSGFKPPQDFSGKHAGGSETLPARNSVLGEDDGMRNRRSVWTVPTVPFKGAHFATFPSALIEPCILAGSRPGDVVFDPFGGSGTTAQVALEHSRRAVLCELNEDYAPLIISRIEDASRQERLFA